MNKFLSNPAFEGIEPFKSKLWLSSPTMHGDEQKWVDEAIQTNWVSTVGKNIDEVEQQIAEYVGVKYAVGLSCGTSALHMATKLAGEKLYGQAKPNQGTLQGHKVFCSDCTFDASINPVAYEDGEAVFIDTEYDTWNMSPEALEKAFEIYPDVKLVIIAHLYGTPGRMQEIKEICDRHGALIVEDAAESLGAKYRLNGQWVETGTLGNYNAISFNGKQPGGRGEGSQVVHSEPRGRSLVPTRGDRLQLPHEQYHCRSDQRPDPLSGRAHRAEEGNLGEI